MQLFHVTKNQIKKIKLKFSLNMYFTQIYYDFNFYINMPLIAW